jgi:hypothetical protein
LYPFIASAQGNDPLDGDQRPVFAGDGNLQSTIDRFGRCIRLQGDFVQRLYNERSPA